MAATDGQWSSDADIYQELCVLPRYGDQYVQVGYNAVEYYLNKILATLCPMLHYVACFGLAACPAFFAVHVGNIHLAAPSFEVVCRIMMATYLQSCSFGVVAWICMLYPSA